VDAGHIQPKIQVWSKLSRGEQSLEVLIRGGNDPQVQRDTLLAA
jgi:hypothetical protein